MQKSKYLGWTSPDFKDLFDEIHPDIVYHIGTHNMNSLKQVLRLRSKYYPEMKVIAFSMRGPAMNLKLEFDNCSFLHKLVRRYIYWQSKKRLNYIKQKNLKRGLISVRRFLLLPSSVIILML